MPNLLIFFNKYKRALKEFSRLFNETKQKEKHFLLRPIFKSGMSRRHAVELGFNATSYMWRSLSNSPCNRNNGKILLRFDSESFD
jgi:hypothetical protein